MAKYINKGSSGKGEMSLGKVDRWFLREVKACSASSSQANSFRFKALKNDKLGNGRNINIWRVPWVGDEKGRFIESDEREELKVVGDLIDHEKMEWRYDLIERNFNERDKKCIYAIPLSLRGGCDDYMWAYSKDGKYTVKTAYMIGKGGDLDDFHGAWVNLWSMDLSPKTHHFMWRICTRSLHARAALKHRHVVDNDACLWCPGLEEMMEHAIFSCPRIRHLWKDCGCEQMWENCSGDDILGMVEKWATLDGKMVQRGYILAWNLWFERNKFVFENVVTPVEIVVQRVYKQAEEYNTYSKLNYSGSMKSQPPSAKKWVAPSPGIIKINSDASLCDDGWVGLSAVARDDKGRVLFSVVKRMKAWWPPDVAEAKAILLAVCWVKKKGLSNTIVESDAQMLISRLSMGALFFADLDAILGDIISLCSDFNFTIFSYVKRDGNLVMSNAG
ncbi:uncharacterized protein LOC125493745 [Beta vulgaris subsp. vulgaris]|uniref:uncharacterized protein LOC125493745 n=1 Tax=Beta vulgaris subsp. vulgaris TaxID=3555 RepID=UPI002036FB8B|nr:uncharacterized protein LOC125493745 [Beta vulgaris subsp. vulgaris]